MQEINKNMYYSIDKLLSFDALYSFTMGARGLGKTYQGKKRMLDLFLKKGKQSIYLRRTAVELEKIINNLFDDIQKDYPTIDIEIKGNQGFINGKCFCYFIALSTSSQYKSASFPNVDFIFFDEYVIEKNGRNAYLKNEMNILNGFVETIFRLRTPKVYICSNAVSYVNPFFDYFKIEPKPNDNFIKIKQNGYINVVVELTKNSEYASFKKKTRFAQMLQNTEFANYAFDNVTLEDTNDFIISKKPFKFNFFRGAYRIGNEIIGCWSESATDTGIWFGASYDKNSNWKYTLYSNQNFEGWRNIKSDRIGWNISYIKKCYYEGKSYYENQKTKKLFTEQIIKFL